MKAIIYDQYGGPEVLKMAELPKPILADNEVLIKVFAVSLNDWDWGLLTGDTLINRLLYGLQRPKRTILGSDVAGRIEAVGKNVQTLRIGDEVFGDLSGRWGGLAEYVCAPETMLAKKSEGMTFEQAAATPQAAMLAVQGLIDIGKVQQARTLLINGAGGGVGTFALQLAKLYDVEVTAVDSTAKLDMLRAMGARYVMDYTREDFTKSGRQYDLILDVKSNRSPFDYARALSPHGIYATVGGAMSRLLQIVAAGPVIRRLHKKYLRIVVLKANKDLAYMTELFEAGKIQPVIDGQYGLDETAKAFELFGSGAHKGKVVISVHQSGAARIPNRAATS